MKRIGPLKITPEGDGWWVNDATGSIAEHCDSEAEALGFVRGVEAGEEWTIETVRLGLDEIVP